MCEWCVTDPTQTPYAMLVCNQSNDIFNINLMLRWIMENFGCGFSMFQIKNILDSLEKEIKKEWDKNIGCQRER